MTTAEATELILTYYDNVLKEANKFKFRFFTYQETRITIAITKILEPWQKDANLALPEKLSFPGNFMIDFEGIHVDNKLINWDEITLTVIADYIIIKGKNNYSTEYFFACCLNNGDIIDRQLGDIKKYANLLGHFIELYKTNRTS